ncbi:hypothetical protein C7212DRAFT_334152 [Tuber magnatum]|uniref:Uncharacterized protein n=1 Tax=Tuber magnatum TaxID=42249 RepID=A0A317SHN4_9PEZI|nr:hypothetical protein C7212DRAFT_334152 [Tuber magnatum]
MHGKPEEHWNFVSEFPQFRHYRTYSIRGGSSSAQLTASSASKTVELTLEKEAFPRELQKWELIFPTPSIPTGWFRMRNTATNATLAHRFTHASPFLIPDNAHQEAAPCNANCCNGNCDKATQWVLVHGQIHIDFLSGGNTTSNRYLLRNRLTGGFLADRGGPGGPTQICCWSKTETQWIESGFVENCIWEVQAATPPHIWEFQNRATRRVLAEIIDNQCVSCVDRSNRDQAASSLWRVDPLDYRPHIDTTKLYHHTKPSRK